MDEANLVWWLRATKPGKAVLREVLPFLPRDLLAEVLEQNRTTYVLVKAYGDGWIEVYGPRHVRVRIIELPATENAGQERLLEEWVSVNLNVPYAEIDYPSSRRAVGFVPPWLGFGEYVTKLVDAELGKLLIEGCNAKG